MNEDRKRLAAHLTDAWYWYLLVPVLVTALWSFVFGLLDKIPYREQINIFVGAYEVQEAEMENRILELLEDSGIRQVTVDPCTPGSQEAFYMVLSTRGTVDTDILILPEGTWPESLYQGKVLCFSEEDIASYLPEGKYKYLEYDGKIYGICVYDAETGMTLIPDNWIGFKKDVEERNYYLFFNADSDNIGQFGKKSETSDDQALQLLEKMIQITEEIQK